MDHALVRNVRTIVLLLLLITPYFARASEPQTNSASSPVIILVHGTRYSGLDVSMNTLWQIFVKDGFPKNRIFAPVYDSTKDWEGIRSELAPQILQTVKYFGPKQHYIVIGHSLGEFAALYTLMKTQDPFYDAAHDAPESQFISSRVDLFVGLAGIARGVNDWDPFPEHQFVNQAVINRAYETLVSAADAALQPYIDFNPRLQQFYAEVSPQFNRPGFRKCALYSRNDRVVRNPLEAGKLSDDWFEVPYTIMPLYDFGGLFPLSTLEGRVLSAMTYTHLDFIRNPAVYRFMREKCKFP